MKVKYLNENINDDWMVGCTSTETLQGTQEICAEKITMPQMMLEKQENSVQSTKSVNKNAVRIMEMIQIYQAVIHENSVYSSTNDPLCTHCCVHYYPC
jgi:hypothetical protein